MPPILTAPSQASSEAPRRISIARQCSADGYISVLYWNNDPPWMEPALGRSLGLQAALCLGVGAGRSWLGFLKGHDMTACHIMSCDAPRKTQKIAFPLANGLDLGHTLGD